MYFVADESVGYFPSVGLHADEATAARASKADSWLTDDDNAAGDDPAFLDAEFGGSDRNTVVMASPLLARSRAQAPPAQARVCRSQNDDESRKEKHPNYRRTSSLVVFSEFRTKERKYGVDFGAFDCEISVLTAPIFDAYDSPSI